MKVIRFPMGKMVISAEINKRRWGNSAKLARVTVVSISPNWMRKATHYLPMPAVGPALKTII